MRYNLSLTDERPLRATLILTYEELDDVYSEGRWLQILRDRKINEILG